MTVSLARLLVVLTVLAPVMGCGGGSAAPDAADAGAAPDSPAASGTVTMTAEAMRASGVVVQAIQSSPLAETFSAPARAVAGLNGSSRVGALASGRVVRLYAAEGTAVRRGAALAEIESMEVADLQAAYLTAAADVDRAAAEIASADAVVERAQASLVRAGQLAAENLTPQSRVEQATEEARTARAARDAARAARQSALAAQAAVRTKLSALGVQPTASTSGRGVPARFVVRAPIGGTVTVRNVQLGEYVEPAATLFEVASAGSGLVEADVSTAQAEGVRVGQLATVVSGDSVRYAARVVAVAPVVEAASRTVPVRVEMVSGRLRPEAFVTVQFETAGTRSALVVPEGAVERAGDGAFVFVEVEPGTFRRTLVEVGPGTAGGVEVRAGLTAGQRIATEGVFYLRSALQKGSLTDDD